VDRRRQMVLDKIRQQTHEIGAATFLWHVIGSGFQRATAPTAFRSLTQRCGIRGSTVHIPWSRSIR
jgi:hypothetical protein